MILSAPLVFAEESSLVEGASLDHALEESVAEEPGEWEKAAAEIKEAAQAVSDATVDFSKKAWEATKEGTGEAWEMGKEKSKEVWEEGKSKLYEATEPEGTVPAGEGAEP
ncbi:MAG: hypothetical protein ABFR63_09700, partial [Thermodesulfobacteriota bacterium]